MNEFHQMMATRHERLQNMMRSKISKAACLNTHGRLLDVTALRELSPYGTNMAASRAVRNGFVRVPESTRTALWWNPVQEWW